MKMMLIDKIIRYAFICVVMLLPMTAAQQSYAASMGDYCLLPPYVKTGAHPNVMIMMDNAVDMGEPAYSGSYNPSTTYSGYFKSGLKYIYGSNRWEPSASGVYSGNLLNWATTSKYDLLQQILVGGISTSRQTNVNTLISKSNTWQKTLIYVVSGQTYTCIFNVNSANLEVTEPTANACGYLPLSAPPYPITGDPLVSSIGSNARLAAHQQDQKAPVTVAMSEKTKSSSGFLSTILTAVMDFLVPSAEAASPLRISGGSSSLTNGTECTTGYSVTISASGGTGSGYTWSLSSGSLPGGLTLGGTGTPSTTISGTPTTSNSYTFTVRVTDSGGNTDTKAYSIVVNAVTFAITTGSLSPGTVGDAYTASLSATAGVCTPYTWSISSGTLPAGLSIIPSTGVISGTPTGVGSTFTVQVSNSAGRTATQVFTLTINATAQLTITTSTPLPAAVRNQSYSTNITAINSINGVNSWSWAFIAPSTSLPAGLTLVCSGYGTGSCGGATNVNTAVISGTPTAAAGTTYYFRVTANDNGTRTTYKDFSLTITTATPRTSGNLDVKVCIGNYTYNCNTSLPSPPSPSTDPWPVNSGCSESDKTRCVLKSGLIDQFWSQARFGVMDFSKYQNVHSQSNISNCIEQSPNATPDPNFMTAVENAVAIDPTTVLVNGEYEAINYYKTNTTNNCDPFVNALKCTKSFVLILTAGVGANNPPNPDPGPPTLASSQFTTGVPALCTSATLSNLAKNSCYGFNHADLRPGETGDGSGGMSGRQYVSTYIVNTMGTQATSGYNPDNAPVTTGDILEQAAVKGGGTYYEVVDAATLKAQLIQALQDIIKRAAAGTAASVLASGEGSGANLIQAVYYPRKQFGNDEIDWIGRLTNLWYFVDPNLSNSNIREEDGVLDADGAKVLTLKTDGSNHDNIVQLYFDTTAEATKAHRWEDTNGDAVIDTQLADTTFESLGNLWEAGGVLWNRNLSSSPRTIYTTTTGTSLISFTEANKTTLRSYLQATDDAESQSIIRYLNGEDTPFSSPIAGFSGTYRSRHVSISGVGPYVWKLGDILNSTPKISSWLPLNKYHTLFKDSTYGVPGQTPSLQNAADETHYITSANYRGRGMIFAGANDGMLHAFKLGSLELKWTGQGDYDRARLMGTDLGSEAWAFIPRNSLPYLKYIADPAYCHVYTVDQTPFIFDASIGGASDAVRTPNDWRTILIGGMRYGGGCRKPGTCAAGSDCVNTPLSDPDDAAKGLGYSSYFAIDITDQNNPVLLWEFANENLGYSTAGPALLRVSVKDASTPPVPLPDRNGKWFVVLGSGPTGPIDTTAKQFLAHSDQPLRLFVLDLKTGALLRTIEPPDLNISNAFAGSMLSSNLDTDLDYQDDVQYIPYVQKPLLGTTWTDGGVLRLSTKEDVSPANWVVSTLMDGIGPVTSSVSKLQNNTTKALWTFFGTGRYFYELNGIADDAASRRAIYGVKDPCFSDSTGLFLPSCTDSVGTLTNVTNVSNVDTNPDQPNTGNPLTDYYGWYIDLDRQYFNGNVTEVADPMVHAERVITDPVAATSGVVFFTTFKPFSDSCSLGGTSAIWAVKYNSGGDASALLRGQALIQVSTGSIEQLKLSDAFKDSNTGLNTGNRKSAAMQGVPPTQQGLSIISTSPPVKRVLHVKER